MKLQASGQQIYWKRISTQVFSCENWEIAKNLFLQNTSLAASANLTKAKLPKTLQG